jgi:hypothetical protein
MNRAGNAVPRIRPGIANCGPVFFTLPTALPTGQVFSSTSGHGLSADSARDRVRADEVIEQGCYLLRRASQLVALSGRAGL